MKSEKPPQAVPSPLGRGLGRGPVPSPSGGGLGRGQLGQNTWVICDPSGEKACMVKEGQWVANYFNTQLDAPCPSLFDALHNLAQSRQSHLSVHGQFDRQNPIASFLSLNDDQKQYWPLWTISATRTNADLIMLSACESNLTGPDTQGLLTPIGIGPSLVAAGAKTVVGTLWSCEGIAALCFNYYFYQIATDPNNTNKPWHHIAAEARQKLRNMQRKDLQQIIDECHLADENDLCHEKAKSFFSKSRFNKHKPFYKFEYWAGFVVLGLEKRSDAGASR
ncbi:protein conserved in bacteria [Beggiatoa sp. PS]|nr:protein conserved in bacteria [Beggiatoa sp. PS]